VNERDRSSTNLRRVGFAAIVAMALGLLVVLVAQGFSTEGAVRAVEDAALGVVVVAALIGSLAFVAVRMADWREPVSDVEFDRIVRRAEEQAEQNLVVEPEEGEFLVLDPLNDRDFDELVREALEEIPDLLRNALRHITVVVSDGGRRADAYGRYDTQRAGADRLVIFRDTLRRDYGHDADALREQVTRTVQYEMAHHVAIDELGVGRLEL
jgi:predicted Zn-dependent protease with MMP-like domain